MTELTLQSTTKQKHLLEWSQRVADCRSSGLSVNRWCIEHNIKPKTYYNWQKKVFAAMIEQQKYQTGETGTRFTELPPPRFRSRSKTEHRLPQSIWEKRFWMYMKVRVLKSQPHSAGF